MTIRTRRRGRRSLAAIVASVLMASVLAVVAAAPAHAANTAFEGLVDTNEDGKPDAREFAGQDRYDTALRLARNFAESKGGLGAVAAVFVASGDTLVDSISAAGFAGYVDAPILLTPSGSLHGQVADFIEDYGVGTVYVLGGMAAVSDATVTAIEGLNNKPMVTRLAGDDRYATAARIAEMIEADSSWCATDAKSAVLINGSSDALPFGVAVQTIAYRLQLPLLMTAADELSDATADFIEMNDIEHVQIVGGVDTVSAEVASALTTLGVSTVARVEGDSAVAVSVELAKMANNGCNDDLAPVSTNRVVLVRGNPDGVAAAPVLSSSLADGEMVTPLIVGDSLPASVRDYLAATPKTVGAVKLNLGIVAVGGTAAVSTDTMAAAVDAAASSGALSVQIGANADTNMDGTVNADDPIRPDTATAIVVDAATPANSTGPQFALYFSDDVMPDLAALQNAIEINGVPAVVSNAARSEGCDYRKVVVTLGQRLAAGDTVSLVASAAKFGTDGDQRTAGSATATVMAAAPDRARPTILIVGIAGGSVDAIDQLFNVAISDNVGLLSNTQIAPAEVRVVAGPGGAAVTAPDVQHTAGESTLTVGLGRALVAGDRLIISSGAVSDSSGNTNASASGVAIKAQASPKIQSVQMSSQRHSAHAQWTVPTEVVAGADDANDDEIVIMAKGDGDAAGAAGNAWKFVFDRAANPDATKPLDIDVRVDTRGKRVTVRFINGGTAGKLSDLLEALKANAAFDERFSAGFSNCADGDANAALGLTTARNHEETASGDGRTEVAIEVNFRHYVNTVANDGLLTDILTATAIRTRTDLTETLAEGITRVRAATVGGDGTAASGGLTIAADLNADSPALPEVVAATPPTRRVRYEFSASVASVLPMAGDIVRTLAGAAELLDDPISTDTETNFRPAEAPVATGYVADDQSTTALAKVDQSMNDASQVRVIASSNVKQPS